METVSVNTCVQPRIFNFASISATKPLPSSAQVFPTVAVQNNVDTVSIRSKREIYLEKLNKLFPNGSLNTTYNKINADFGIDQPPKLVFADENNGVAAGGYTFEKNEISVSLQDLMGSDTKIVGIKDGKRMTLVSPTVKLPLFVSKESAEQFIKMHSQNGNLGFDQLVAEPITEDEHRKFIVQKLAHEVIHAQQHMLMRQSEKIGEKEIIKAWTHKIPKNTIDDFWLNVDVANKYKESYWMDKQETQKTIKSGSVADAITGVWLEAIRNYPKVGSDEYEKNPIEVDAYNRSADYVAKNYGWWN